MTGVLLALILVLAVGFLGTWFASRLRVPHSVFLVAFGVAAGLLFRTRLGVDVASLKEIYPDLVLYVLLPPLVFESAYHLDFRQLQKDIVPLGVLSVVALVVSTFLVGYALHWFFGIELLAGLVFGALISATDPVAVVALFKDVGAPRRLSTLIEGESLLNDGTAIVLFRVLLASVAGGAAEGLWLHGIASFVWVSLGGLLVGWLCARVTSVLLRLTSESAASQIGMTVVAAYASFLVADRFVGVSGVISTLALGLSLGRRARLELNRDALEGMRHIWEFLALCANTLVFLAVGLTADLALLAGHALAVVTTVGIAYAARAFSVFATIPVVNALGLAQPISFAYQVVLFWGGLRGGLALGLVLLLPPGFPHKDLFLVLALAVVLSTLTINALTTKRALKILKLDQLEPRDEGFLVKTLELVQESAFGPLRTAAVDGTISPSLVDEQRDQALTTLRKMAAGNAHEDADLRFAVSSALLGERREYELRLMDGVLSRDAYLQLIQLVDHRLEVFNEGGLGAFEGERLALESGQGRFRRFLPHTTEAMLRRLTTRLEVLLHLRFALEAVLGQSGIPDRIRAVLRRWHGEAGIELQEFYRAYPHYGAAVQSSFIANTITARSALVVRQLFDASIISGAVRARAAASIARTHREAAVRAAHLMRPTRAYLIGRIPLFKELPRIAIQKIADSSRVRLIETGHVVFREGDPAHSFFVVAAGLLEVRRASASEPVRLLTGDFFGEMALLFSRPRKGTVVALMTSELLELEQEVFEAIMREYPTVRERIRAVASERDASLGSQAPARV